MLFQNNVTRLKFCFNLLTLVHLFTNQPTERNCDELTEFSENLKLKFDLSEVLTSQFHRGVATFFRLLRNEMIQSNTRGKKSESGL